MNIYIPTYGRKGKQKTFNRMTPKLKAKTFFVIRPEEYDWYKRHTNPPVVCEKVGVPAARQAAFDHCQEDKLWFFDDDLNFSYRPENWSMDNFHLKPLSPEGLEIALDMLEKQLDEYAIVGMDERAMNQGKPQRFFKEAGRIMRAFGIRKDIVLEEGLRFDKYLFWEDFHIALSLYKKGYKAYLSLVYLNNGTTNTQGGVSSYRDFEKLKAERDRFLQEHSPFAVPVDKRPESWQGISEWPFVPDVKVYWKKALIAAANKLKGN